jgi:hypothetical protein
MHTPTQWVPSDKVRALGKGLGADGNLWIVLPDNAEYDLKLSAPARHYNAGALVFKHKIKVMANGHDLSTTKPEFCVGQNVSFDLTGLPLGQVQNLVGTWKLPAKYVNEEWQHFTTLPSESPEIPPMTVYYGSVNYRINSGLLENTNQTSCWFVNGSGGRVSVGMSVLFSNGQSVSVAGNGNVAIYRPTVFNLNPGNAYVVIDTNYAPEVYLGVGDSDSSGLGSMTWDLTFGVKPIYRGTVSYLQLINRSWSWDIETFNLPRSRSTGGEFWLDNIDPYTAFTTGNNPPAEFILPFGDGPSLQDELHSFADLSDSFQTYARFQPIGGIPITLGRISWSWHGQTARSGEDWVLGAEEVVGPTLDASVDSFPEWTKTYYNTGD